MPVRKQLTAKHRAAVAAKLRAAVAVLRERVIDADAAKASIAATLLGSALPTCVLCGRKRLAPANAVCGWCSACSARPLYTVNGALAALHVPPCGNVPWKVEVAMVVHGLLHADIAEVPP